MLSTETARPASQRLFNIAIVGATGAVGVELMDCLARRNFPVRSLKLLASPRSAGRTYSFQGRPVAVEALTADSFTGVDIAIFAAGASISREFAPIAAAKGALVVDNSSAFRMQAEIPLVVPEVNGGLLADRLADLHPAADQSERCGPVRGGAPLLRLGLHQWRRHGPRIGIHSAAGCDQDRDPQGDGACRAGRLGAVPGLVERMVRRPGAPGGPQLRRRA